MKQESPHIDALLEYVLCFPADDLDYMDAATVVSDYSKDMQKVKGDGSHTQALPDELTALLKKPDDALKAQMEESWEWEHGLPDTETLRAMFAAYINEINRIDA